MEISAGGTNYTTMEKGSGTETNQRNMVIGPKTCQANNNNNNNNNL